MGLGAVLFRTGETDSHLGGLFKSMPWTTGFCIVGHSPFQFPCFVDLLVRRS